MVVHTIAKKIAIIVSGSTILVRGKRGIVILAFWKATDSGANQFIVMNVEEREEANELRSTLGATKGFVEISAAVLRIARQRGAIILRSALRPRLH